MYAAENAYYAFEAARLGGDEREGITAKNFIASRMNKTARLGATRGLRKKPLRGWASCACSASATSAARAATGPPSC